MNELQVLGIPGSLRTGSYNRALLENNARIAARIACALHQGKS